jgi:SAM-dependent methyltransferase
MTLLANQSQGARESYDEFAPYYDSFTAHHDYDHWTSVLEGLAQRHGLTGRELLDVACGTGKSFLPMLARGYRVTACDASRAMVDVARAKPGAGEAQLFVADMRDLPTLGSFDFVTCIDDAINYLLDEADLEAAFRCAATQLAETGLYLFDVNTLATYRSMFAASSCVSADDHLLAWEGRTPADFEAGGIAEATVHIFSRRSDGSWTRGASEHRQRHHPRHVVERALETAGLEPLAVYGQSSDGSTSEELVEELHTKAVYVARSAAQRARERRRR